MNTLLNTAKLNKSQNQHSATNFQKRSSNKAYKHPHTNGHALAEKSKLSSERLQHIRKNILNKYHELKNAIEAEHGREFEPESNFNTHKQCEINNSAKCDECPTPGGKISEFDTDYFEAICLEAVNNAANNFKVIEDEFDRMQLSNRERGIALRVAVGQSNSAIARDLFLTESTVKFHVGNIYKKAGVKRRQEFKDLLKQSVKQNSLTIRN
jgi:DNA-binding CsgD family transcriptional regulator